MEHITNKYPRWIKWVRLIARTLGFFCVAVLALYLIYATRILGYHFESERADYGMVMLVGLTIVGFLITWKWELLGALIVLVGLIGWFVVSPTIIAVWPWFILPMLALAFILCWWEGRKYPASEQSTFQVLKNERLLFNVGYGVVFLVVIGIIVYARGHYSNDDFRRFVQYRSIKTEKVESGHFYSIEKLNNGRYRVDCPYYENSVETYTKWNGDEMLTFSFADGGIVVNDLHVEDSTIVRADVNMIIPRKAGKTRMLYEISPGNFDTIPIEIVKARGELAIVGATPYLNCYEKSKSLFVPRTHKGMTK